MARRLRFSCLRSDFDLLRSNSPLDFSIEISFVLADLKDTTSALRLLRFYFTFFSPVRP